MKITLIQLSAQQVQDHQNLPLVITNLATKVTRLHQE